MDQDDVLAEILADDGDDVILSDVDDEDDDQLEEGEVNPPEEETMHLHQSPQKKPPEQQPLNPNPANGTDLAASEEETRPDMSIREPGEVSDGEIAAEEPPSCEARSGNWPGSRPGTYAGYGSYVAVDPGRRGKRLRDWVDYKDLDAPSEILQEGIHRGLAILTPSQPHKRAPKHQVPKKDKKKGRQKEQQQARQLDSFVRQACERLGEPASKRATLREAVNHLSMATVRTILGEVDTIEAAGGMLTEDKKRRRTPGGVFWKLVQSRVPAGMYKELLKAEKREAKKWRDKCLAKNKAHQANAPSNKGRSQEDGRLEESNKRRRAESDSD